MFLPVDYTVNCTLLCNVLSTRIALSIKTLIGWLTLSLALLGVATLATGGLLQVVGLGPTTTAQGVRLVPALTERWSSLRLGGKRSEVKNKPSRLCSFNSQLWKSCLSTEKWITENHMFRHLCLKTSLTRLKTYVTAVATWCWVRGMQCYRATSVLATRREYGLYSTHKKATRANSSHIPKKKAC